MWDSNVAYSPGSLYPCSPRPRTDKVPGHRQFYAKVQGCTLDTGEIIPLVVRICLPGELVGLRGVMGGLPEDVPALLLALGKRAVGQLVRWRLGPCNDHQQLLPVSYIAIELALVLVDVEGMVGLRRGYDLGTKCGN